jgi:hypothetical protein
MGVMDIIVFMGVVFALIPALQGLGFDTRIFGRDTPVNANTAGQFVPKWRWWLVLVVALLALIASTYNIFTEGFSEKNWLEYSRNKLQQVRNKTFTNEKIELDGMNIHDCVLVNSTLIYRGKKPFIYQHNKISGTVLVQVTYGPQQGGMVLVPEISGDPMCVQEPTKCVFQGITDDGKPMPPY